MLVVLPAATGGGGWHTCPPTPWVAWGGAAGGAGLTFFLLRAAEQ
jgi:hypothetical protein